MLAKWETMFECRDNQEVGLEAAILERVRNSSLVKCSGADNSTGLKPASEAMGSSRLRAARAVGERSCGGSDRESGRGAVGSENAGMSSARGVRIPSTDCPRFPE